VVELATNDEFALKVIDKQHIYKEKKVHQPTREKKILEYISHPNIVTLYCTFQDQDSLCEYTY
jgi:3-phosphoinositide dependent protein kinase-1